MSTEHAADVRPVPALAEIDERPVKQLNRPLRAGLAAAELLLAVTSVLVAMWAWRQTVIMVELPPTDNPVIPRFTTATDGRWMAAAVALGTLAGLLVLDAVRQAVLVVRR
jgi:hypothetical protein